MSLLIWAKPIALSQNLTSWSLMGTVRLVGRLLGGTHPWAAACSFCVFICSSDGRLILSTGLSQTLTYAHSETYYTHSLHFLFYFLLFLLVFFLLIFPCCSLSFFSLFFLFVSKTPAGRDTDSGLCFLSERAGYRGCRKEREHLKHRAWSVCYTMVCQLQNFSSAFCEC